MADFQANFEVFAAIVVLGGGLVLTLVSLFSFQRLRTTKALLVGLGFLGIAVKGAFLTWQAWRAAGTEAWILPVVVFDLWVLVVFYAAMRTR